MIQLGIKELCELRAEAGRLRQERDDLMRFARLTASYFFIVAT